MTVTLTPVVHSFSCLAERVLIPEDQAALAEHVAEIRRMGKRVIGDTVEIGRRLTECQKIVGHGNWIDWPKAEFDGWSDQTARRFIHVYERSRDDPEFNKLLNSGLPPSAFYLLAAPSTPNEVCTEIIERVEAGETVSVASVKDAIANAKASEAEALLDQKTTIKPTVEKRARRTSQQCALERFATSISNMSAVCCYTQELTIPPLDTQHINDIVPQLEEARAALGDFIQRIKSV